MWATPFICSNKNHDVLRMLIPSLFKFHQVFLKKYLSKGKRYGKHYDSIEPNLNSLGELNMKIVTSH